MGVRLSKKFLLALVGTASKNLDQTTLAHITPAQLMRKAATVSHTQVTLSGKTPRKLAMRRRPRDLLDPAFMNPEQLTSTPTKQDLLNEETENLAMRTHLEVQQREDIRRDLAERMKFVPPDFRAGENVFYWQEDPSKIQQGRPSGKWLKVEVIAVKGRMAVISTGATIFSGKRKQAKETFGHRRSNRCLGAVLFLIGKDFWLQVPIDIRTKRAEIFSPQLFQNFWFKLKRKNPKTVVMSPTVTTKSF